MKLLTKILSITRFSSKKKFYELVAEDNTKVEIPRVPEQVILSRFITETQKKQEDDEKQSLSFVKWKKQKTVAQKQFSYQKSLNESPYGSVKTLEYKKHNITLLATNYNRVDERKMHKFLYVNKPDAIVVQRRPQYYMHNFQVLKRGEDGIFSDRLYLEQLKASPAVLNFRDKSYNSNSPLETARHSKKNEILEKYPKKQLLHPSGFDACKQYIQSYTNTDLYLSEMPMRSYKQWLANKNTLMQLQQMFKNTCKRMPRYKNFALSPYQLATLIYPDIFLKFNDLYMATIIQMLVALRKYQNIVGVFGIVENQAVKNFLENGLALQNPLIESLIPPGPKSSIVRDIQNFEVIEKHILLDIFFYGDQILDIQTKYLHTTNAVSQKYSKDESNKIEKETLLKFRYQKTVEYLKLMQEKYKEGEEQIKKEFIRETLRRQ